MNILQRLFYKLFDRRKTDANAPEIGRRMADVHEMRRHAMRDQAIGSQTGRLPVRQAEVIRPSFTDPQAKRADPVTGLPNGAGE